jgi:hypothetical protein
MIRLSAIRSANTIVLVIHIRLWSIVLRFGIHITLAWIWRAKALMMMRGRLPSDTHVWAAISTVWLAVMGMSRWFKDLRRSI